MLDHVTSSQIQQFKVCVTDCICDGWFQIVISNGWSQIYSRMEKRSDNPIIYASQGFCLHTGYSKEEIEGRNCRFLQGKNSNPTDVSRIREAIEKMEEISLCLLNYRKDGSSFLNQVKCLVWIFSRNTASSQILMRCYLFRTLLVLFNAITWRWWRGCILHRSSGS